MAKRTKTTKPSTTHLVIRVESHEVEIEAGLNISLRIGGHDVKDDELVFESRTNLVIKGTCIAPATRAKEQFEVSIYGSDSSWRKLEIGKVRKYDKDHCKLPVSIQGLTGIECFPPSKTWYAFVGVSQHSASDMLVLLGRSQPLFLAIDESIVKRDRWIQSIALLTTDHLGS
jgi:hypothetical protein